VIARSLLCFLFGDILMRSIRSPWLLAAAGVLTLGTALTVRAVTADENAMAKAQVFQVVQYSMTSKWDKSKSAPEQPGFQEHFDYVKGLYDKGSILLGGAFADSSGAIMILNTTPEDAKKIASDDPFVKNGLLTATPRTLFVPFSHAKWDVELVPPPPGADGKGAASSCGGAGSTCGGGK
jgi:uncharacterized protein YciI